MTVLWIYILTLLQIAADVVSDFCNDMDISDPAEIKQFIILAIRSKGKIDVFSIGDADSDKWCRLTNLIGQVMQMT